MSTDEYDPDLLSRIEMEIAPLMERLAEDAIAHAKKRQGTLVSAPVPFVVGDEVAFENGEFAFHEFDGPITRTADYDEILDLLVTAWITHVMSELEEGHTYSFDDIVQMIARQLDSAA